MELVRHLSRVAPAACARVIACGQFDGVHRGHRVVLARLVAVARACDGEAMVVLDHPGSREGALASLRQQLDVVAQCGVDRAVLLAARDPHDLASIAARVSAAAVVTAEVIAPTRHWAVERVEPICDSSVPLSAAIIRAALERGDLAGVANALGRPPAVEGRVVHGFHRGAGLGIPTANLHVRRFALPPDGVYAVRARLGRVIHNGVANIGRNPTFGNTVRSVEAHLLDFSGDLYGQRLEVAFIAWLRGERRFDGVDALVAQIHADIAAARVVLGTGGDGG